MTRAHLRYTVTDQAGNAILNARVRVLQEGTSTPINDAWDAPVNGNLISLAELLSDAQGRIVCWLSVPKRVDLLITDNAGGATVAATSLPATWVTYTETRDVLPSGSEALSSPSAALRTALLGITIPIIDASRDNNPALGQLLAVLDSYGLLHDSSASGSSPSTPANLTASTVSGTAIDLSWSASSGNVPITYQVWRSTLPTSGFAQIGTTLATTFSDTGLTAATIYYYQVRSTNAQGTSAFSTITSGTTTGATDPTVPTSIAAVAWSSTRIDVTWVLSTGTGTEQEPITYEVQHATSSGGPWTTIATPKWGWYPHTSLTPNTPHFYRVRAVGTAGNSAYSATATTSTPIADGTVYVVPTSIDYTGATDAASAFFTWVNSIPDGTPTAKTVIRFQPGGTYLAQNQIFGTAATNYFSGTRRHDLIFDLNGATIVVTNPDDLTHDKWKGFWFFACDRCAVHNGTIEGGRTVDLDDGPSAGRTPNTGTINKIDRSGVEFSDAHDCWAYDLTINNVWGDFITVQHDFVKVDDGRDPNAAANTHSQYCLIEDCSMLNSGRTTAVINGEYIEIRNNTIDGAFDNAIDFEPDDLLSGFMLCRYIYCHHNHIVRHGFGVLSVTGPQQYPYSGHIWFEDNEQDGANYPVFGCYWAFLVQPNRPEYRTRSIHVNRNGVSGHFTEHAQSLISQADGVEFKNNKVDMVDGGCGDQSGIVILHCTGLAQSGNTFTPPGLGTGIAVNIQP